MSLLIEALKKAEADARIRKQAAAKSGLAKPLPAGQPNPRAIAALPALVPARDAPSAELKLAPQTTSWSVAAVNAPGPDISGQKRAIVSPLQASDFPELTLALTDFSAHVDTAPVILPPERSLDPEPPVQAVAHPADARNPPPATAVPPESTPINVTLPNSVRDTQPASRSGYKVADKTPPRAPRDPATTGVMAARSAAYSAGVTSDKLPAELTPHIGSAESMPPPVTQRQAMSAASVMAGKRSTGATKGKLRRQDVFLGIAVLLALPVLAFYMFGDALLSSTGTLSASAFDTPVPAVGIPAAVQSTTPAVAVASSARPPEATVPILPARPVIESRIRVPSRPDQESDKVRRVAPTVANQATPAVVAGIAKPASIMASAYAAYQTGKPDEAIRLYREVLKSDPSQRDAWLGLAVISHADNQREPAIDAYKRVLRLEPQNATALAGLSSLNSASDEPRQESRLREFLARSPQEADLNHALGLTLSGEQRWSEAQPLFFKAHTLAPQEPKFAYNLAVTLDHLRKSSLAIQYYETALSLAKGQSTAFDEQSARNRVTVLKASAAEKKLP